MRGYTAAKIPVSEKHLAGCPDDTGVEIKVRGGELLVVAPAEIVLGDQLVG